MKLTPSASRDTFGAAARMLGLCVQSPSLADVQGRTFWEAQQSAFKALPKDHIRHPNGTKSYSVSAVDNPEYVYMQDTVMPNLAEGVTMDLCIAPASEAFTATWASQLGARLGRLTYGNEPPNNTPSTWADGADYATRFKAWHDGLSAGLQAITWFQTGKPEVLFYAPDGTSPTLLAKHQSVWDAMSDAVLLEGYPARLATTHKLRLDYPDTRYEFYKDLLERYRTAFGPYVQVLFHEFKLDDGLEDTEDAVLLLAEFLCIMSRLIFEEGATIAGGAYQQGAGPGTINLIGRNESNDWQTSWVTDLWTEFGTVMQEGAYVQATFTQRPDRVSAALFQMPNGRRKLLYANLTETDEPLSIPKPRRFKCFALNGGCVRQYRTKLPARTAGVIDL